MSESESDVFRRMANDEDAEVPSPFDLAATAWIGLNMNVNGFYLGPYGLY